MTSQTTWPRTSPITRSSPPDGSRWTFAAAGGYLLLLISVVIQPLVPAPGVGQDYAAVYGYQTDGWIGIIAAALGLITALVWPRATTGRAAATARVIVAALCLWTSAGLVLDAFRFFFWATGIPAGEFGLVEWQGAMARAAGGVALVLTVIMIVRTGGRARATSHHGALLRGSVSAAVACVYPAVKYYWALGGSFARPDGYHLVLPLAETVLLVGGVALSLFLIRGFKSRILQVGLVASGWLVALVAVNQGMLPLFGVLNHVLGGPEPSVLQVPSTTSWVTGVIYASWALFGLLVAIATGAFVARDTISSDGHQISHVEATSSRTVSG